MQEKDKISAIKYWLGNGSINLFGLPYAGKDTVGARLAEVLGAKLVSSGDILREHHEKNQESGSLTPTNLFLEIVLPYFHHADLKGHPLILSMIGRWHGEEEDTLMAAKESGHEVKAVLELSLPESEVLKRWEASFELHDRDDRLDGTDRSIVQHRLNEYADKVEPALEYYQELGLLSKVDANQSRDEVFTAVIDKLHELSQK
ncbi:MAG: nucleoside monophosphate kinase [Candidatus Nomurabacteria bacterium]|jgi:adenylate kinase|nr:nucleoside monophosphate kinase [Candidatus Nomurabacteria bacterium]